MMRALQIDECGRPPAVAARPEPVPGPGLELVRVVAAPITPLDLLCATGTSYFGLPALPYVPEERRRPAPSRPGRSPAHRS
ncbi:NADPH:quinone reductase, partial [Nonomuraea fuscirosea]